MLEQKNPLIARKKSWGAHACVCTRRAGFRIARDQAAGPPPPCSGGWHKGHRHPRESSAALSQAPRCTAEGSPSKTVGTRSQAAKRSDIEGQYRNLILSEGKLL